MKKRCDCKRTLNRAAWQPKSASPSKTDCRQCDWLVGFVPTSDIPNERGRQLRRPPAVGFKWAGAFAAIFYFLSQASNDADRPHQHHCARLGARSKPRSTAASGEIHAFQNSQNAVPSVNSIGTKSCRFFPSVAGTLQFLRRSQVSSENNSMELHLDFAIAHLGK